MATYIIGLKTESRVIYTPSYEIRSTSSPSTIYWQCLGSIALFWVLSRVRGRAFALFALHNAKILLLLLNFFCSSRTGINKVSEASQLVISLVLTLFSSLGIVLASRQIWLQRFSTQESLECIPSLNFLIETLPWNQIVYKIYLGGTDCAKVDWVFLGGSIADWSAAWFALLLLASVTLSLRREDF